MLFTGCKKQASNVYHCQDQDTYCCSLHLSKQTKQKNELNIANLRKNLTRETSKELSVKATQVLKYLKSLKRNIRNSTLEFIDQINSASHKVFENS